MLQTLFECLVYLAFFPGLPLVGYLISKIKDNSKEEKSRYEKYRKMFEYSQKYNP